MTEQPVADRVVLCIGRFESTCGACGTTCHWDEPSHTSLCGYDQHEGCGAIYTHVQAQYWGMDDVVSSCRPDLTFIPSGVEV